MATDLRTIAFEECFDRLLAGEGLEQVLQAYPQWEQDFRPLLEAAQAAMSLRPGPVPETAIARSRERFLSEARNLTIPRAMFTPERKLPVGEPPVSRQRSAPSKAPVPTTRPQRKTGFFGLTSLRLGLTAALVVLALFVGSISTVAVSAQSLPGDALYPIKLITEKTRLFFTKDPARRLELEQTFDQKRAQEVNDLILRDRSATVNFAGGLTAVGPNEWLVDDIRVLVAPGTHITGELRDGYYVNVQGTLQVDGTVLATRIWTREFEITGEVYEITSNQWRVDGLTILVDAQTLFQGAPAVGSQVTVLVSMLATGELQARSMTVLSSPAASDTLKPSDTPEPSATAQPPTRTLKPTETKKPPQSEDNETPEVEETDEPTKTPKPTDDDDHEEEKHETPKPTKTPKPTEDDDDDDEEHNTPQVTASFTPTSGVSPTPDPEPTDDD